MDPTVPAASQTTDPTPITWRPLGRYELGPRLAAGGMAELYVARTPELHGFRKYFAVKRILPRFSDDREFVEMFLDEARLAAHLDHPNVVHVHDIGEDDDGLYFTMDYIHGQNLLAIVRRHRTRGTSMPWDAFVALGSAAAAGLHHAHERRGFDGQPLGIIHRDVSPTNILVTYEGAVKIVDFGIAKASTSRHATRPSVRKGKMAYMSPEQCRGDPLDRRSDVFALGVVLYELATLTRAFHAEGEFATMNQIVNHDLPPASSRRAEVPAELDRILARAVARDPAARYGSARELQRELDGFAVDQGLLATPEALAAMMEELFGNEPYPWESAVEATLARTPTGAESTAATHAKPSTMAVTRATRPPPPTEPTTSNPSAVQLQAPAGLTRAGPRPWILGGLALVAAAAIAWIAVPSGEAASPDAPAHDELPSTPGIPDGATPRPAGMPADDTRTTTPAQPTADPSATPAAPALADPFAATSAASLADPFATPSTAAEPTPVEGSPDAPEPATTSQRPDRRTSKPTRSRTTAATTDPAPTSPTLPAPFDPDAPAPRVR
jgi:serine/threonine protein kinase